MKKSFYFANRYARQLFMLLALGAVAIQVIAIFTFYGYTQITTKPLPEDLIPFDVLRMVHIAKTLPVPKLMLNLPNMQKPGISATVNQYPLQNAQLIYQLKLDALRQYILSNLYQARVSVKLADGRWFNVYTYTVEPNNWQIIGFGITLLLLLIALVGLCAWAVNRLATPLEKLADSAKRFSQNMQAEPLEETGPESIRLAIQAFNKIQANINRVISDRTQMLAAISHDLRTPITRLKLRAESVQDPPLAGKIITDINEMEYMINSILVFAKHDYQNEALETIDLNALLATICDDMIDTGHKVHFQELDTRLSFKGRLNALKRALTNLIENAVKYGNEAWVELSHAKEHIQIKITDNGPGIAEAELEKVFLPFYRANQARTPDRGGTGLGLSVARDIIHAHGGEIRLMNRLDQQGLCVLVNLPQL